MRNGKRNNARERNEELACPHCGAGSDGETLGLFWDFVEHCWRCIMCGYRGYECQRPKTNAGVMAEKEWDEINAMLDQEILDSSQL